MAEYEPGCENYDFSETHRERLQMWKDRFENEWGFVIGPLIFFGGLAIALIFLG